MSGSFKGPWRPVKVAKVEDGKAAAKIRRVAARTKVTLREPCGCTCHAQNGGNGGAHPGVKCPCKGGK